MERGVREGRPPEAELQSFGHESAWHVGMLNRYIKTWFQFGVGGLGAASKCPDAPPSLANEPAALLTVEPDRQQYGDYHGAGK